MKEIKALLKEFVIQMQIRNRGKYGDAFYHQMKAKASEEIRQQLKGGME